MPAKPPVKKLRPDQHHEPTISDDQVHRIGLIIVAWSKLEATIEDTIWMFLDVDEEDGKAITKRLGADTKIQLLRTLGATHITEKAFADEFAKLISFIDELKDCRNFIAHGVWGTVMPEDVPVALSLKPKSEIGEVVSETFDKDRMASIHEGIEATKLRLIELPEKIGKPRRVPEENPGT